MGLRTRYRFRSRPYDEGFELLPGKRLAGVTVRGKRRPRLDVRGSTARGASPCDMPRVVKTE